MIDTAGDWFYNDDEVLQNTKGTVINMKSRNNITPSDMSLKNRLFTFSDTKKIPLQFNFGGKTITGIPDDFSMNISEDTVGEITRTYVTAKAPDGLKIIAEYTEYTDFPVTEWVFYFENTADGDTPIISDIRVVGTLSGKNPVLYHGNGDTLDRDGYSWKNEKVENPISMKTLDGTSCNGAFPYMRLKTDFGGYNIAVGWSGSWQADFSPDTDGTKISVGQLRSHLKLKKGEKIRTPSLLLMAYTGDENRARNLWRKFFFKHITPRPLSPKLCLCTFGIDGKEEFTGATEENQLNAIKTYLEKGFKPDIWWLDAGWYECGGKWWDVGDWTPNRKNFPNGLAPIGKFCEKNGIDFLLWFEPERCHDQGKLYKEHPEWFLSLNYVSELRGVDYSLNLGIPEARQWITEHICELINDGHIKVYRQDFNYNPMKCWEYNEADDRIGAIENFHIQGYYKYFDELLRRNPDIMIDSCAAGGRRNDLETIRRAVPFHYTDVGYGEHPIKQKQHRQMFEWIPFFRAHTKNNDDQNGNYGETERQVDEFAYYNAFAPAITSTVEYFDSDELFALGKKMNKIWRRAAEMELRGDYYPLSECNADPHDDYAMQFDDPENADGFIEIIRNTHSDSEVITVFPFAEKGYLYEFSEAESEETFTLSGDELLNNGFSAKLQKRSAKIWFYKVSIVTE